MWIVNHLKQPTELNCNFMIDRVIRICALGALIYQACTTETETPNYIAIGEAGKAISEEAGYVMSQLELIPDEVQTL